MPNESDSSHTPPSGPATPSTPPTPPVPHGSPNKPPRRRFTRLILFVVFDLVIIACVAVGAYFYIQETTGNPPAAARPTGPPVQVTVLKVEPQTVALHPEFLGQTAASKVVEIRARVAGFLQSQDFAEGTQVEKGSLLYRIDPSQYLADLAGANAKLAADKAQLEYAQQQFKRYQKLVQAHAATPAELENWKAQMDVARANIAQDQAQIEQAKLNLSYTYIKAPMTGMIGKSQKDVGAFVDAASNSLLDTLQKVDPIYVTYSVSESDILNWQQMIRQGVLKLPADGKLRVSLTLGDDTAYPQHGTIDFTSVEIDPSTGTAMVRAVVPNPKHTLRPGQYVHVNLLDVNKRNTVLVPQAAVQQLPTGSSVYTVDADGKVLVHPVTLGQWYKNQWVIKSGLKPGDRVLLDHLMSVRPGQMVHVKEVKVAKVGPSTKVVPMARKDSPQ